MKFTDFVRDAISIFLLVLLFPFLLLLYLIDMKRHPLKDRDEWHEI